MQIREFFFLELVLFVKYTSDFGTKKLNQNHWRKFVKIIVSQVYAWNGFNDKKSNETPNTKRWQQKQICSVNEKLYSIWLALFVVNFIYKHFFKCTLKMCTSMTAFFYGHCVIWHNKSSNAFRMKEKNSNM